MSLSSVGAIAIKMSSDKIPPFPQGSFIDAVRESSKFLTERTKISVSPHSLFPFNSRDSSFTSLSPHRSTRMP